MAAPSFLVAGAPSLFGLLDPATPHDFLLVPSIVAALLVGILVANVCASLSRWRSRRGALSVAATALRPSRTTTTFPVPPQRRVRPQLPKSLQKEKPSEPLKMVLLVRKDLGLSAGSVAGMTAIGAVDAIAAVVLSDNTRWHQWHEQWEETAVAKVALQCPNADTLQSLVAAVREAGLPVEWMHVAATVGGAAVGPAPVSLINAITGALKLL